ncbi:hypothetical protein [Streptomyces sp. 2231.1]|uniref:hypothetical protein n=1 Tax=Streptomyces sp. 2231.1 TaxID=1855347 RepID=UPI00115FACF8|nr:hypothetical protein [Streptomyces sp. 2231.1]
MDAGTAAVLGALAGSVATIGAAMAAGWAQREGARIVARSQHRREMREARHGAYEKFISSMLSLHAQTSIFQGDAEMVPEEMSNESYSQLHQLATSVERNSVAVALAGPKEVTEAALKIARMSVELVGQIGFVQLGTDMSDERQVNRWRWRLSKVIADHAVLFENSLDDFVYLAQAALDDDGSAN